MPGPIESSGSIEILCFPSGAAGKGRGSVPFFEAISLGDRVSVVFNDDDGSSPPYTLKIFSPSGANILDTVVRELPTGAPQSPPPIDFIISAKGTYRIEIKEMRGRQRGEAKLRVE